MIPSTFYGRDDVLFLSLHGNPLNEFPYFLGFGDEIGCAKDEGSNVNYPMPAGADFRAPSACRRRRRW